MSDTLVGTIVEIHLLNGNRFLGKITAKDRDGVTLRCIPMRAIDNAIDGENIAEALPEMLHTLFIPYVTIEYLDIGGEPVGFDELFAKYFGGRTLTEVF